MKIVISPAKSLNFEKELPTTTFSEPQFLKQAATIQKTLKKKKPKALSQLMDISDKLAELNWQRNQDWQTPFITENARQAIGPVELVEDMLEVGAGDADALVLDP